MRNYSTKYNLVTGDFMLAWVKYKQILSEKLYWDGGDWLTRWYLVKFLLLPNYCSVMSERVGADPELWPAPHMCRLCHWWRVATSTGPGLHLTGHRWFRPKYTVNNFSCLCVNLFKRNILMIKLTTLFQFKHYVYIWGYYQASYLSST